MLVEREHFHGALPHDFALEAFVYFDGFKKAGRYAVHTSTAL
jgi:hypothetical protein